MARLRGRQWTPHGDVFFIIFSDDDVYLVFYHDYVEGGVISSMAGAGSSFERPPHR